MICGGVRNRLEVIFAFALAVLPCETSSTSVRMSAFSIAHTLRGVWVASLGARVSTVRCHGVRWRRVPWYFHTHRQEVHADVVQASASTSAALSATRYGCWKQAAMDDESCGANLRKLRNPVCGAGCGCLGTTRRKASSDVHVLSYRHPALRFKDVGCGGVVVAREVMLCVVVSSVCYL